MGHIELHIDSKAVALIITIFVVGVVFGAILLQSFNNNSNPSTQETNDANPDDSGLTIGQMSTEEIKITSAQFTSGYITATVSNTGTTEVTINEVSVNGAMQTYTPQTFQANEGGTVSIGYSWNAGYNYQIKLVSSKGNSFMYVATAPS